MNPRNKDKLDIVGFRRIVLEFIILLFYKDN